MTVHAGRRVVFGANEIIVPMTSVTNLFFLEVLNPFYIFQLFSFTLWAVDDYIFYASAIFILSCISVGFAVKQTRKNQKNLSSRVHSRDVVNVLREGMETESVVISTEQLVPGDVIVLPPHGCIMHCDAVLLTGNCIVNESMLTGESVPVTKTPLPNNSNTEYDEKEHARHTLFCGTQVIQTRYYGNEKVLAVVVRTGFSTAKGKLVRSILHPPPVDFKFERDSYKFVQLLACVAAIGVLYTVVTMAIRRNPWSEIILKALDLITIVVPPALPAAMTVGRMYAQARLEKANIFCISPRTINVAGSINCVCFDKTGTLTEDGLDMWCVAPVHNSKFHLPVKNIKSLPPDHLLRSMVTCHSITIIEGNLAGDPLDIKVFESTGWTLEEPEINDAAKFDLISPTVVKPGPENVVPESPDEIDFEIGIVRQFTFSSSLQRMSVITRTLGANTFTLYCKGSPEMILSLCDQSSVPSDFQRQLEMYTKEGYRVLALAYKDLPPRLSYAKMQRLSREEAESNLILLGLVVMENRLKPQTSPVLHMLRDAQVRTIMVTGDNMLTALSVARDCEMVPPGQTVIMIHTTHHNHKPILYFTQSTGATTPDTTHVLSEMSQMTATESLTSLQTIGSNNFNHIPNGTARNSVVTELPFDINIEDQMGTDYSFALTGTTWSIIRSHYPELVGKIITRGSVFARMSPDQKQLLVQELQQLEYFVAMVGDGANDCGALKAAHAGISLSEAESSVASPFTSKTPNISCIVEVIKEGRAALVTSFAIFKYMAAYSLMQFGSVIILYSIDSNLTDVEYLYIDLFVITTFAFVLGKVKAYQGPLYPTPPQSSLISISPIFSLLGQMIIAISIQFISFFWTTSMDWYNPPINHNNLFNNSSGQDFNTTDESFLEVTVEPLEPTGLSAGYANYSLFTVSSFQYIILALVFSKGAPYRKSLFLSPVLMGATIIITAFSIYLVTNPFDWLKELFELVLPPSDNFKLMMLLLAFVNLVLAFVFERISDLLRNKIEKKRFMPYELINQSLKEDYLWPPISNEPPRFNETSPTLPGPPATITVVNTPPGKKRLNSIGPNSVSDLQLEKFSTPMRSVVSLMNNKNVGQSEDSLSGYQTPPTSLGSPQMTAKSHVL
ncbi:probable cation-transporting ATPase 13A3 isoform X2 [Cimex lectularius]|uniref:P-type ATPase A domain-containing protein n=1 Tax=Cimex lectularius TaxID=79782 RepID=A0A8I6S4J0_CIMLE|nr:probable cation-transporting ATPase 13A3 isoform X2 [Cimex lectularius]